MAISINNKTANKQAGFTLTELLIVISIMVIAISIATPSLQDFIRSNNLTTTANSLVSSIIYAKSEAVSRREEVSITPSGNGWQVTRLPVGADPEVLAVYTTEDNLTIDLDDSNIQTNGMRFTPDGFRNLANNPTEFCFSVTDPNMATKRYIIVSPAGNTRVIKSQDEPGACNF